MKNSSLLLALASLVLSPAHAQKEDPFALPQLRVETRAGKIHLSWGEGKETLFASSKINGNCKNLLRATADLQVSTDLASWTTEHKLTITASGWSKTEALQGPKRFWRLSNLALQPTAADVKVVCHRGQLKCFKKEIPAGHEDATAGLCPGGDLILLDGVKGEAADGPNGH